MKPSTKPKADATSAALPSYQQMLALSLAVVEKDLQQLLEVRVHDEHWSEEDLWIDLSVELSLGYLQTLKTRQFAEQHAFPGELSKIQAPLRMGVENFSRKDCMYMRCLVAAEAMVEKLGELMYLVPEEVTA